MRILSLLVPSLLVAGPSFAQDWDITASLYGWAPDTAVTVDTPAGPVSGELSFSEAWEALDFAFMGSVTADRGRLGFILDTLYLDLSDSTATASIPALNSVGVESQISMTSAYAMWQLIGNANGRLDVGGGLRYYAISNDVALDTIAGPLALNVEDDWLDPLIALRYRAALGQDWYATFFADAGGFGVGSETTWQAIALVGYQMTDSFSIEAGYRTLSSDRISDNGEVDIEMSGPALGVRWRF